MIFEPIETNLFKKNNLDEREKSQLINLVIREYKEFKLFDFQDLKLINHPISKAYKNCLNARNTHEFKISILSLMNLLSWIINVEFRNKNDYSWFKKRLFNPSVSTESFNGDLFELFTYNMLAQRGDCFLKREKPDFEITFTNSNDKIFIECVTCQFAEKNQNTNFENIKRKIKKKLDKTYANENTVLYLNISNILETLKPDNNDLQSKVDFICQCYNSWSETKLKEKGTKPESYGAIVVLWLVVASDKDGHRYHQMNYKIIYNSDSCSSSLREYIKSNELPLNDPKSILSFKRTFS